MDPLTLTVLYFLSAVLTIAILITFFNMANNIRRIRESVEKNQENEDNK